MEPATGKKIRKMKTHSNARRLSIKTKFSCLYAKLTNQYTTEIGGCGRAEYYDREKIDKILTLNFSILPVTVLQATE